jgi:hypothetical protein
MKNSAEPRRTRQISSAARQLEARHGTAANGFRKNQFSAEYGRPSSLVLFSPGFPKQIFSHVKESLGRDGENRPRLAALCVLGG